MRSATHTVPIWATSTIVAPHCWVSVVAEQVARDDHQQNQAVAVGRVERCTRRRMARASRSSRCGSSAHSGIWSPFRWTSAHQDRPVARTSESSGPDDAPGRSISARSPKHWSAGHDLVVLRRRSSACHVRTTLRRRACGRSSCGSDWESSASSSGIAIAFWPARVAARKGHSFLGYFLLSLLFFPLADHGVRGGRPVRSGLRLQLRSTSVPLAPAGSRRRPRSSPRSIASSTSPTDPLRSVGRRLCSSSRSRLLRIIPTG